MQLIANFFVQGIAWHMLCNTIKQAGQIAKQAETVQAKNF